MNTILKSFQRLSEKYILRSKLIAAMVLGLMLFSAGQASAQFSIQRVYGSPCTGQQQVFVLTGGSCSSVTWYAYPTGSATIISQNSSSATIRWNNATNSASVTAVYNGCQSYPYNGSSSYPTFSVSGAVTPSVSITGPSSSTCSGASLTYTATPVNGGSTPYYNWRVNGTTVSSGTSRTYTTSSLVNGDVVSVVMTSNASCLTTAAATSNGITVSVPSPTTMSVTISNPSPMCGGTNGSFVASVSGSGSGSLTYQWYRNGSPVTGITGPPAYVFAPATALSNGDRIQCRVTTTSGCVSPNPAWSNEAVVSVTSPVTPTAGIGVSTIYYCVGDNLTFTATSGYTLSNFQWRLNGNPVGTNSSTYTTNAFTSGSVVTLTATASGSCLTTNSVSASSSSIPFQINNKVTPSVSVSATSTSICAGSSVTFTANPVNGGPGPSYNWQVNGTTVSTGGPTYTTSSLNNGDVVRVILNSNAACRTADQATSSPITMTVNPVQAIGVTIPQPSPFCGGTGGNVTANVSGPGNFSYTITWYKNGSPVTGIPGPPSYVYAPPSTQPVVNGDKFKCLVTTTGPCANPSSVWSNEVTVTVNTPVTPTMGIGPSTINYCIGDNLTFTASSSYSLSNFQWRLNGNPVGTNSATYTTNAFTTGSEVTLTATASGGCLSTNSVSASTSGIPFSINPKVTPSVTVSTNTPTTVCAGTSVTFTANPVNGGSGPTYNWYVNGASVQNGTSPTLTRTVANGDVVYVVMTSFAVCRTANTATSPSISMTVNPIQPITANISQPSPFCGGTGGSVMVNITGPGSFPYTITWYKNGSPVTGIPGPPSYVYAPTSTDPVVNGDKIKCLVTTSGQCASPASLWSNEVTVTVNTPVTPTMGIGPDKITLCEGESITFTASSAYSLSNFQWRLNGNPVGTNSASYTTNAFTSGSTVTLNATATGGCLSTNSVSASSAGTPFTFKPTPNATLSPSGSKKICADCTETLTAAPIGTGHTYQWIKDGTNQGSPVSTNTYAANVAGIYSVTVAKDGCSKTSPTLNLTKNVKPVVNAGTDKSLLLPANTTTLTGTASDPDGSIASLLWTQVSGPPCTITGINTLTISFKGSVSGDYIFRLTATDNFGDTNYDEVLVRMNQPANNFNYVRETTVLVKDILTYSAVNSLTIDGKTVSTNYLDGLAKQMQQVQTQYSPQKKDVVIPVVYDAIGRQARKYLPLPSTESNGNYKSNTSLLGADGNYANNYYGDSRPFSETTFEASPLSRPVQEYGAGEEWFADSRKLGLAYLTNIDGTSTGQEKVIRWVLNASGLPVRNSSPEFYASGELYVKSTQDEQGNETREYLDKRGRVVLKKVYVSGTKTELNNHNNWAQTYYVYDVYDQVRYVFQPELSKVLASGSSNPSPTDLFNFAFQYKYDAQRRLTVRQPPSSDAVYMVYDSRNRVVLTQSGNQRKDAAGQLKKEWTYTKYDAINRTIISGVYVHTGAQTSQEDMQLYVDGQMTTGSTLYEDYNGVAATHGYTNRVFPTSGTTVHTVTYYDNYDFKSLIGSTAYNYLPGELTGQDASESLRVVGQVTGSKVNVLETTGYLWNVNYYDDKYRVIQTVGLNHKNGLDRTTNVYDFVRVKETKTSHSNGSASYSVRHRFEHDHGGRLKKVWHTVGTAQEVLLAQNEYNELSELTTKKLHSRNTGTVFAQKTDYQYNIRGWLRNINNVDSPEKEDLFNLRLNYNTPSSRGGSARFNGNISEAQWSGAGMDKQIYAYEYDNLNRLISATYVNPYRPLQNGRYDEKVGDLQAGIQGYDFNGNIKRLFRNGKTNATAFGAMDDLTYVYTGNRLTRVNDAIATNANEGGFKNGTNTDDDYAFDWNGNTTKDNNKGVSTITYNHLNLPVRVSKNATDYIEYRYDATGKKLSQQVFGSLARTTDYIGDFVYENNALKFILHEEGRIIPDVASGSPLPWEYQYFLKDHLDNTRVVFSEKKSTSEFLATMERDPVSIENSENAQFLNINNIKKINAPLYNHTAGTNKAYSYRLSGAPGEVIGPAKSFSVNPGETFDIEVFAKYANPRSDGSSVSTILNSLVGAFSLSSSGTGVDGPGALNAFNTMFASGAYIGRVPPFEDGGAPKAFLNYILFDENFVLQDFGFDQISTAANQSDATPVPHDYLNLHLKIKQKGYLYVYLSNENPTIIDVFFDDFKIVQNSAIEQTNDYYAFGLTFNNYQRAGSVPNNYLYHGNELQDALSLGWLDYGSRMYESSIARWMVTDPLADKFQDISPYAYALNNPVVYMDPDGESPISIFAKQAVKFGIKKAAKEFIEAQIKKKISEYVGKKVFSRAFAKTLAKDADDLLTTLDSEWWEYVIEVIPVAGDVYGAASLGKKGVELWKGLKKLEERVQKLGKWASRWGEKGAELIEKTVEGRSSLRKSLGLKRGDGKVAHHVIPVTHLENNDVVQAALQAGFDFNGAVNGKGLDYAKHNTGGHRKYNQLVSDKLSQWAERNENYKPEDAKKFLEEELIPWLNKYIDSVNRLD